MVIAVSGVQRIQVALHHADIVGDQNNKTVEVDVLFEVTKKNPTCHSYKCQIGG